MKIEEVLHEIGFAHLRAVCCGFLHDGRMRNQDLT